VHRGLRVGVAGVRMPRSLPVLAVLALLGGCDGFLVPQQAPHVLLQGRWNGRGASGGHLGIRPRSLAGFSAFRREACSLRDPTMQLKSEVTEELQKLVQEQLSSVKGIDALDRTAELFSNSVPNRPWEALFTSLAASDTFRSSVWASKTMMMDGVPAFNDFVTDCFTMSDVERHAAEYPSSYAAQGTLSPDGAGGWFMKRVGAAQAADASTKFGDVQESLKQGTVVLNSAGAYISPLASVSLAVLEALQLPVGLNLYITAPKMQTSAPPHTDKQDVFVLQAQGAKHWRVYAPPEPSNKKEADPYARGKGPDKLVLEELGEPLIETVLNPGSLLYMPAGFPHTTDTIQGGSDETSIHLTIGIDTHIWGLTYAYMRQCALQRAGQKITYNDREATSMSSEDYLLINEPLPLGFLAADIIPKDPSQASLSRTQRQAASARAVTEHMALELAKRMIACEKARFEGTSAEELVDKFQLRQAAVRFVQHYQRVMGIQRRMYLDGKIGISAAPSTLMRVQQYMGMLDAAMEELIAWSQGRDQPVAAAAAPVAAPAASVAGEDKPAAKKGMGMGGAGAAKKKKKK